MKKIISMIFLLCFYSSSYAGTATGTIDNYIVTIFGKVFLRLHNPTDSPPSCSGAYDWAIDLTGANAAGGKALLGAVIAASAQGKTITIIGTGDCSVWGDREAVSYIVFS